MKVYVNVSVCLCYVYISVNRYFRLFLQFVGKIFLLIVLKNYKNNCKENIIFLSELTNIIYLIK